MLKSLPNIPLFQNLEPAQIALLKPLFELFICPPDTTIFEQGEPANYLYYLIKGDVAIRYKPYDSPLITLTRLHGGDVFGWSAVIGSTYYTSSIISESQIEALRIRGIYLLTLVREHPETGKIIMDYLANVVSSRWKNARAQVQSLLNSDITK
jgi:CRP-like cAMP-binding protein